MTTPAGKYKHYQEDCPKEEYDLDEKEYLIKIREIVGGTQSWDEMMESTWSKNRTARISFSKRHRYYR